jgi:SAM-dependent methyltransferase
MPRDRALTDDVARYYDSNTRRFLALGGGAESLAIHRALWGPGVVDGAGAAAHINELIGDALEARAIPADAALIDLGCGVGGTLFALAARFAKLKLHGITISPRQCSLARSLAARLRLADRCAFYCGDFETLEPGVQADVAIAVESMVHARSASGFLDHACRLLTPGGTLIVVDDFIIGGEPASSAQARILQDFRAGWRLSSLTTVAAFVTAAESAGFVLEVSLDLTPLIRLDRFRDKLIGFFGPALRPFSHMPMLGNLVGGAALTRGLRGGSIGYRWLALRRGRESGHLAETTTASPHPGAAIHRCCPPD